MACSKCGQQGHNSKTCTLVESAPHKQKIEPFALWVKIDGISEVQADDLLKSLIDIKREIAPDGRATYAKAEQRKLPAKISEAMRLQDKDSDE